MNIQIIHGDCLEVMKGMADNSVDAICTDPPYGLKFMGKKWDYEVPKVEFWQEAIRVLKPGGHILCACGTRTQHRMAVNIEDGGFEIRDIICWHYGSGFPKSLDISKAIDREAGAVRETDVKSVGDINNARYVKGGNSPRVLKEVANNIPLTDEAKEWDGFGTALKPATELWTLARKPISEKTIAANVLKWGTGGLNVDGCRVGTEEIKENNAIKRARKSTGIYGNYNETERHNGSGTSNELGRFPANVIFDEFMAAELDKQTGNLKRGNMKSTHNSGVDGIKTNSVYGKYGAMSVDREGDEGGRSRFFYVAKPDTGERNRGTRKMVQVPAGSYHFRQDGSLDGVTTGKRGNHHPTVKPVDLMRYLIRLITPKDGIVLDPFNGSGTTGVAAKLEFMNYIGIEREKEYCDISEARLAVTIPQIKLFD